MDAEGDKHEGGRESVCSDTGGDLPGVDTNLFPLLSFKRKKLKKLKEKSGFEKKRWDKKKLLKNEGTNQAFLRTQT